ncbi:hypothetical protein LJC71_01600 [Desulfosarcina sp. OttesenSCG-928-A07]|nr:hypothetical protein [Desulfosarcina sp. OttesenSCG-928-G17]MDL2328433.1 hypothetical protein [Desulfosarcina sp. OttesenSCG-928-A07]
MITSPGALRTRLFLAFSAVTLIAALLPAVLTRNTLYNDRMALAGKEALARAVFAKSVLDADPDPQVMDRLFHTARQLSCRMTLTDASGQVVRDSHIDMPHLSELDNHGDRPEIEEARTKGHGISLRHSNSLGVDAVYAAVLLENGGILRMAVPAADVRRDLETEFTFLGTVVVGVIFFCLLLTALITKHVQKAVGSMAEVVASISRDKRFRRLRQVPGKEFLPLAHAVNTMADTIEAYVQTTQDQHGQLESILECMHEGVLVLSPGGTVRRWNKAIAALFPDIGKAEGKPVIEAVPVPALQDGVDDLLGLDTPTRAPARTVQFELPPGRFLVAHLTRPLHSLDSLGVIIVIYDATEIMRLGAMRRDFVSNVSHELRTPLTAIRGYAEILMLAEDLPEERRAFAAVIHHHAAALSKLISDLLVLARIENDPERIEAVPVDASTAFADAVAHCREKADAKGLGLETQFDPRLVLANASLLSQVFRNLLENACRYAPENSIIRIASGVQGTNMHFSVSDNGPGIPKEALTRIFERFFQVREERNSGTSGIGLAICKHIIERHGGGIWAESPHASWATAILFTLPLAD